MQGSQYVLIQGLLKINIALNLVILWIYCCCTDPSQKHATRRLSCFFFFFFFLLTYKNISVCSTSSVIATSFLFMLAIA